MQLSANYDFDAHVHLFRYKEMNIVLDVNSGAVHLLDDMAAVVMRAFIDHRGDIEAVFKATEGCGTHAEVEDILEEFEQAFTAQALFTDDDFPRIDLSAMYIKALCLNVAHACNMKCGYCFAAQGDFGLTPSLMDIQTAQQAVEFLLEKSGPVRHLEIDFFGGEPLLVKEMLQELVDYCRQREKETGKHFNFTLTTNALYLDEEMMAWIIKHDISIILSLDGRQKVHDQHRLLRDGQGSYDLVLPRIKAMVDKDPISYFVRGTFTRHNLDFSKDLQHMIDLGFDYISLEPAVGPDNGYSILPEDLPVVLAEYDRVTDLLLARYEQGREVFFFHYNLDLQKGPCLAKRSTGCGAGVEYLVITPQGDIYPCHQFVGQEEFYMGSIKNGELNGRIRSRFENNQVRDKECARCWARNFCGGGCHANAYFSNHDMSRPHETSCMMHKKRLEGAIYLELKKKLK